MSLYGKSMICTQDWELKDIMKVLARASEMKTDNTGKKWQHHLNDKVFLMIFFSPSLRTRLSFSKAIRDLGGVAETLESHMAKFDSAHHAGESIEDIAKVTSEYVDGIGIRAMEGALSYYGEGQSVIRQYDEYAKIPVINMADDTCHPCQAMADILTWREFFSTQYNTESLNGKKLLVTWGKGRLARSWNSPQASLLLASQLGMDITLARPEGYDMDETIYQKIKENCDENNQSFRIIDDPCSGYEQADIVYSRNWISSEAYEHGGFNKHLEIEKALNHRDWITTEKKMRLTNNAIFAHPMPIDREYEVESEVVNGANSVVYETAKNRVYVQKSLLSLIMHDSSQSNCLGNK